MKRYFPSIKQYSWVILVAFVIALVGGVYLAKITPSTSVVNSIMLATVGAPGTTIPGEAAGGNSLDAATNYASEMISRSVMEYVVANNSDVRKRNYTADDLLADVVAVPSTTSATVIVTATTSNADDSVLLANAVASGFQNYIQSQRQAELNVLRNKLQTQLNADVKQKSADQQAMQQIANTTDIRYILASNDLQNVNQQINNVQSQFDQFPTTVNSDIVVIQQAKPIDVQSSSKRNLIIAAAGVVGILIGTLIMFLMIFLDDRLRGEDRVKEKLGMAFLGGLFSNGKIKQNAALAKATGIGLAGLLRGTGAEPVDSVVVRSNIPGVWVLPGGQKMEDPTLLLGKKFPSILAQLRKKTDLIIIDGPSLLSGSDALLLATMVDGVALVLDSRHDKLKLLLRAKEMLSTLTHTHSGVILNRMPRRKKNSYFASVTSSDSDSEQRVSMSTLTSPGNGNGNGDVSGYDKRGEKVATFNSTVPPMNGIDSSMNGAVPVALPSVPKNGIAMPSELTAYPPSQNGAANANKNPQTPLFMPRR